MDVTRKRGEKRRNEESYRCKEETRREKLQMQRGNEKRKEKRRVKLWM